MELAIIKYNAGNIQSVLFALERIGVQGVVTDDPERIRSADRVIFPGVGEASTAMQYLRERKLDLLIKEIKQPLLGICLGMQLLCSHSEENDVDCLGVFNTSVRRFPETALKVPQIGWNNIETLKGPLFRGIKEKEYFYFVHSYFAEANEETIAVSNYGQRFASALSKNNFYGVQFHPEKSANAGEQVLKNFLTIP